MRCLLLNKRSYQCNEYYLSHMHSFSVCKESKWHACRSKTASPYSQNNPYSSILRWWKGVKSGRAFGEKTPPALSLTQGRWRALGLFPEIQEAKHLTHCAHKQRNAFTVARSAPLVLVVMCVCERERELKLTPIRAASRP
jgi:hypothetical protein